MIAYTTYKEKIASRYIPVDAEQIGIKIVEAEYYVASIKYDGYFGILSLNEGGATLFGPNGKEISVPEITQAASKIKQNLIIAGEICCFKDGRSTSHRDVSTALANPGKHDLRFAMFDIVDNEAKANERDLKEIFGKLKALKASDKVFLVEHQILESRKDIISFYKEAIANGNEGLVVKASSDINYKIKPLINLDLVVLGYAESTGQNEGKLRELLLGVMTDGGKLQIVTKCGNGFTQKDREIIIEKLEPLKVESEYTEVSGAKTAFIMVKPTLVVEIKCLDLINETTKGGIRKMELDYDEKAGYKIVSKRLTFSCISPVFLRFREDKKVNTNDAGEAQAVDLLPAVNDMQQEEKLKLSAIIRKRIFTKTDKNGTAIRKFSILKTNKEHTGMYPPFLVLYVDYSSNRKTPMNQDLFLCIDQNNADEKLQACIDENVNKGWIEYDG